jgi:hypothetical protein
MNRAIPVVVFAVLLVGCKPPSLHLRARAMTAKIAALVGKDGAPPMPPAAIDLRKRPKRTAPAAAPAPAPAPAPRPIVTTTRHDRSRPTTFLLKGQSDSGEAVCREFSDMKTCTTDCTMSLRTSTIAQCACYEMDESC